MYHDASVWPKNVRCGALVVELGVFVGSVEALDLRLSSLLAESVESAMFENSKAALLFTTKLRYFEYMFRSLVDTQI